MEEQDFLGRSVCSLPGGRLQYPVVKASLLHARGKFRVSRRVVAHAQDWGFFWSISVSLRVGQAAILQSTGSLLTSGSWDYSVGGALLFSIRVVIYTLRNTSVSAEPQLCSELAFVSLHKGEVRKKVGNQAWAVPDARTFPWAHGLLPRREAAGNELCEQSVKYVLEVKCWCAGTLLQNLALQISFYFMAFLSVSGETFIKYTKVGFHFLSLTSTKRPGGEVEGNDLTSLPFDGSLIFASHHGKQELASVLQMGIGSLPWDRQSLILPKELSLNLCLLKSSEISPYRCES